MRPPADPLDKVIERHKLPTVRCPQYKENRSGSCWYDSVTFAVNKAIDKGTLNLDVQLQLKSKGSRVTHSEVRAAICNFLQGDDCIMKGTWIKEHIDFGDKKK